MKISDATIELWKSLSTNDFWKDAIDVEFDCDEQCMYSFLCMGADNLKTIGKWCPHYCEKLVEILQKESKR